MPCRLRLARALGLLGACLALGLAGLAAAPAQAQDVTLVSNFGANDFTGAIIVGESSNILTHSAGQRFTTGANAEGYVVKSLTFRIESRFGDTSPKVSIYTSVNNDPGAELYRFESPSAGNGEKTVDAQTGAVLRANTSYFVVFGDSDTRRGHWGVKTNSLFTDYDTDSLADWSFAGRSHSRDGGASWGGANSAEKLNIKLVGEVVGMPTGPDATGRPTISGTAQVYHELTAGTDKIWDRDGTTKAKSGEPGHAWTYQWQRAENNTSGWEDIAGARGRTYFVQREDGGTLLRVNVSFHDDDRNPEGPLSSEVEPVRPITDVPWFEGSGNPIEVAENTAIGTRIGERFNAGTLGEVMYALDEDGEAIASIDMITGQLQLTAELDYESARQHVFNVKAMNQRGRSAERQATIVVVDVDEPPEAPQVLDVTVEGDYAVLTWTAPDNPGPAITHYNLRYRVQGTSAWLDGPQNVAGTESMLTNLVPGTIYDVQVRAVSDEGASDYSLPARFTTLDTPLDRNTVLTDIVLSRGTLTPTFDRRTLKYEAEVDDTFSTVNIRPVRHDPQATLAYTDENEAELEDAQRYNSGFDFKPTKSGQQVNITVTARDGQSSQTYRLTIIRVGQPARITRVEFFNLRSGQKDYRPGDTVDVLLGYNKPVEVTGTPTIKAVLGLPTRNSVRNRYTLDYVPQASSASQLIFRTVLDGRADDSDLTSVRTTPVELNGGTIRNRGTDIAADLRHGGAIGPPVVTRVVEKISVTSTPRRPELGIYGRGETIQLTVEFTEPMVLSGDAGDAGDAAIGLTTFQGNIKAGYVRGSGTDEFVFEWTIAGEFELDDDPVLVSTNDFGSSTNDGLIIAAGDLTYLNGMEANPTHEDFGAVAGVDNVGPKLTRATVNGDIVTLEFDEPLDTTREVNTEKFTMTGADGREGNPEEIAVFGIGEIILKVEKAFEANSRQGRIVYSTLIPGIGVRDRFGNGAEDFVQLVTNVTPATTNTEATGQPGLPEQARQGQPLNVDVSEISDPDGVPGAKRYEWVREHHVADMVIYVPVATTNKPTWTPTKEVVGARIGVEVSFIDKQGHAEGPLRSTLTEPVLAAAHFGELRLTGGADASSGRLEMYREGKWGTVCDDGFSETQAPEVACRQLGYVTGTEVARARLGMSLAPKTHPIWMDDVRCDGDEDNLWQCSRLPFGVHNCKTNHSEAVHLECGPATADRPPLTMGILDVPLTHNGQEFKVRIAFSEPIVNEPNAILHTDLDEPAGVWFGDARSVSIASVEGRRDLWAVTVQAEAGTNVSIFYPGYVTCESPHIPCTRDGRPSRAPAINRTIVALPPLTADFGSIPTDNSVITGNSVNVHFSEAVTEEFLNVQGTGILHAENATIAAVNQVSETEFLIDFAGASTTIPTTITLRGNNSCSRPGAPCTPDGRPLSKSISVEIPAANPDPNLGMKAIQDPDDDGPLTASFTSVPDEHDGKNDIVFNLVFSHEVYDGSETSVNKNKAVRDALVVDGGTARASRRLVKDSYDAYQIKVKPDDHEKVVITLNPPKGACTDSTPTCTPNGRKLGKAIEADVAGPATIKVFDDTVDEGPDAALEFVVKLSRVATGTVTVDYETEDGSALAGVDYTATSGVLTFERGETKKTITVSILNDSLDEEAETMKLLLSDASGAYILDDEATGTIENSDLMPQAWLARFGRTVAEQVLEAVEERIRAAPEAGVRVTVAGQRLGGEAPDADAREEAEAKARLEGLSTWIAGETEARERRTESRSVAPHELLTGSSFALTSGADGLGGGLVSLWGRGAVSRFDGREDDLTLDGEVTTGMLGADWTRERWTAGLMLSHARGEGGYRGAEDSGEVSSTVTGLYPYGRYALSERVTLWGAAGYGAGALVLTPEAGKALKTDMDLMMAAAGLRGVVVQAPAEGGPELSVKTDALGVRTSSEAVRGSGADGGNLAAATADVTRLRLGLEGTWRGLAIGTGTLEPRLEVGVRHDGGDAETGFGLDLGGGLSWSDPGTGIRAEASGRGLLTHESAGFRERGIAGSFGWDPTPGSDRGPSLTLTQTLGVSASGGADALLGRRTLAELAANDDGDELGRRRLEVRLGYGFGAFGDRFTLTPEAGFGLSQDHREYSLVWRLVRDRRRGDIGSLALSFEATRREAANDDAGPEHAAGFRIRATW